MATILIVEDEQDLNNLIRRHLDEARDRASGSRFSFRLPLAGEAVLERSGEQ